MSIFRNKVVVVTGAGAGIGREIALCFVRAGARLAISDIHKEDVAETARICREAGGPEVRSYMLDVSDKDAVVAHAAQVLADFGAAHYLINNAGVTLVATVAHATMEELEWQINVNLWGVIYATKAFLPIMLQQHEGCIVNISSVFGLVAFPLQAGYSITKFGVRALTEALWYELAGTGVRAVCVHPGGIRTNIEKTGRLGKNAGPWESQFQAMSQRLLTTPPGDCARDIVEGIRTGKRRILTGHRSTFLFWLARLLPNHYPEVVNRLTNWSSDNSSPPESVDRS